MEENTEKSKNKCQYCGIEVTKGKVMHERYCKQNPEVNKEKPREEKEQPKEPQQEQKPLSIFEIMQVDVNPDVDDLPWFEDANGNRKPEMYNFIGIHENIPCVLVMTVYGRLVPPYIMPGFIGMFPKDHEFPEPQEEPQKKQEAQHIAPEEDKPPNPLIEPNISPLEADKIKQVIPQEPIHAQEQKKKSIFGWPFGKKEKTTETTNSSADLAKRILDAQST